MIFHSLEVRQKALTLLRDGIPNSEVARRLGIAKGTVGYWKHKDLARRGECPGRRSPLCPRCDGRELDAPAYVQLLGLYLGDGHILCRAAHGSPSLSITMDDAWPGIQDECESVMRAVLPDNSVHRVTRIGCHDIKVYSNHLPCLFPQHGPGPKNARSIVLAEWQRELVDAHPWKLIRGLIHSDGCRLTNWTVRTVGGEKKRYEYPRYWFTNTSDDIRELFTDTLDKVGVMWTSCPRGGVPYNISVARKPSVALMDAHVGPKY
ncbi:helix-turn-helix domain-containing protein [Streptomyces sp. AJ-1]|uniref:helix-turn-helix domain-containing protein n=1 Tax=Streptomyces sp. AJ-1 TaxID=3044384 RepID=UPI00249B9EE4|nr:helix-turn-helix domain-containing protein [Streptomyces sp. AJ-1]MDI3345694.1 helix-turn-helix domain-containing protein [Streptomyces sp. AJ-1]